MKRHLLKHTARLFLLIPFITCLGQTILAQRFIHPGGLHTQTDLDRMKAKVAAAEHPWIDGWNLLIKDRKAQNTYKAAASENMRSRQRAQDDATAMYYNALRWHISGDESYAQCAVRIANDWSSKVNAPPAGDALTGIPIGSFALAAEVLRTYPGWPAADVEKFKAMMLKYWYPKCSEFLKTHGGSPPSHYWANWDACNMLALLGIGVFCDDRAKFDEAVEYFKNGAGMGSIKNAVPFIYPGGLGQWQEAGRDFAHTMGGQGLLSEFCQMAWNQGLDLFGYDDNRLLKGAEYAAQYTLWKGVPYTYYTNADKANQHYISTNYHGRLDASHFELLYNHYVVRKGLKAPNVKAFAELRRPEPGEIDIFGYGTLTFTLDAKASPFPAFSPPPVPRDLIAISGLNRVELNWSPSGAYTAHGYEVFRATSAGGPFESIHATRNWTTPAYVDEKVSAGTTYYYCVSALSQVGASRKSKIASATSAAGANLPKDWTFAVIGQRPPDAAGGAGHASYADAANGSIILDGVSGHTIGGAGDDCSFAHRSVSGDVTITARLISRRGDVSTMAVMMRESPAPDARTVALTLGGVGSRQARFGRRDSVGGKWTTQNGNDYTWLPIWFRIQRVGDIFTATQSPNGTDWYPVGKSTVSMGKNILVGVAAAADNKSQEAPQAAWDNVAVAVTPPPVPAAPNDLAATASNKSDVALTWKNNTSDISGVRIEAAWENGIFYEIADLIGNATKFVNTGLKEPKPLRYRVRAYTTGGNSEYSNAAKPSE